MSYTAPSVTASGISFATFQSDGASGHLEALIAAQACDRMPNRRGDVVRNRIGWHAAGGDLLLRRYRVERLRRDDGRTCLEQPGDQQLGPESRGHIPVAQVGQRLTRNTYIGTASAGGPFTLAASGTTASTRHDLGAAAEQ